MSDIPDAAGDWSAVASAWDRNVDDVERHTAAATEALIDRVAVQAGDRVLELAAGPGSLGATWSQLAGPTGTVVLSDIAPGMVEVAAVATPTSTTSRWRSSTRRPSTDRTTPSMSSCARWV